MAIEEKSVHQAATDQYIKVYPVTFAAAATRTNTKYLDGRAPVLLYVGTVSKTQGQTLRVYVSTGGTTYSQLWSAGTAVTVAVQPSQAVRVDPQLFWGVHYIRLAATEPRGTASTQHAATIDIVARLI
jgi:hypothetical protein